MTTVPTTNETTEETAEQTNENSGMSVSRMVMLGAGGLIIVILLLLIFALVISLTASETWAPVIQIFRDIFAVVLIIQGILVIGATAILIIQIARFFVMLQVEIKPILDNARETAKATKATAQFVSQNTSDPIIQIKSFFAGLGAFLRELLNIRRIINPKK